MKKLKNYKVKSKLLILTSFLVGAVVFIGIISLLFMNYINKKSTAIATNWMPSVISAQTVDTLTSDYRNQEYMLIIASQQSEMDTILASLKEYREKIDTEFKTYQ